MKGRIVLFFCFVSSFLAGETWFRSNPSGMVLNSLTREEAENSEYYIKEIKEDNRLLHFFYKEGEEFKNEELFYDPSFIYLYRRVIHEGNKRKIIIYKDGRSPSQEQEFEDNVLVRDTMYIYDTHGRLYKVNVYNRDRELEYSDTYIRGNDGSLRKIVRKGTSDYVSFWLYKNEKVAEYWFNENNTHSRTSYYPSGQVKEKELFIDGKLETSEIWAYDDKNLPVSWIRKDRDGILEEKRFNRKGLVEEYRTYNKNILQTIHNYTYKGELVASESVTGHGKKEKYVFSYSEDDSLSGVSHYINNSLIKKTEYEEEKRTEHYFRKEVLYLKLYFEDDEKVREEYYIDGNVFKVNDIKENNEK